MLHTLISHSPDLNRLDVEGYEIEVQSGFLFLKHVPYITGVGHIKYGVLIASLTLQGNVTAKPADHTVWWKGDMPHTDQGQSLADQLVAGEKQSLTADLTADYLFSRIKPNGYADYYDKMTSYERFISRHAQTKDAAVTAKTFAITVEQAQDNSPFCYVDTASSRAGIAAATEKLRTGPVAIIGVGGTGAYILDLIAKTPAQEIHLFDGDKFGQHNAFRAPGAAPIETLKLAPQKAAYYQGIYTAMHCRIFAHGHLDEANSQLLQTMSFAFVAVDDGEARKLVVGKLHEYSVPFIDVGMGIAERDATLFGTLRHTLVTVHSYESVVSKLPMADKNVADLYTTNIQVADLNALSAALAVIQWKKSLGFYADIKNTHSTYYQIHGNVLSNED